MKKGEGLELFTNLLLHAVKYPELTPDRLLMIGMEDEKLSEIMTPARREMIATIRERQPNTVGELARILKRKEEAVSADLKILRNCGIVTMERSGRTKKPLVEKELLIIPMGRSKHMEKKNFKEIEKLMGTMKGAAPFERDRIDRLARMPKPHANI